MSTHTLPACDNWDDYMCMAAAIRLRGERKEVVLGPGHLLNIHIANKYLSTMKFSLEKYQAIVTEFVVLKLEQS